MNGIRSQAHARSRAISPARRLAPGPVVGVFAALALMVVLAACGARDTKTDTAEPPTETDVARSAQDATYSLDHVAAGRVAFASGAFSDSASGVSSRIVETEVGDLDGDERPDAAVLMATQTGGTGTFMDLYAVLDRGAAGVISRGPATLGDRVKVDSIAVGEHAITVHLVTHAPQDPLCCPTQRVVQHYALRGDTLVRKPQELP